MKVLVVADVHGCYFTFKSLLRNYWNPEDTLLIQVGDMINKGPHSARCIKKGIKLKKKYPHLVYFLLGNHEYALKQNLKTFGIPKGMDATKKDAVRHRLSNSALMIWVDQLLPYWETPDLHVSHAGIARKTVRPTNFTDDNSLINNRKSLRNIGKTQVVGHVVQENGAYFNPMENAWHIDGGAFLDNGLSALLIDYNGKNPQLITEPTAKKDLR